MFININDFDLNLIKFIHEDPQFILIIFFVELLKCHLYIFLIVFIQLHHLIIMQTPNFVLREKLKIILMD